MPKKTNQNVGYYKPPVSGQFKPGHSGNPKGRPKGRRSPDKIIADVLNKKITVTEGGKTKRVSQIEALCRRVFNDGLKGNPKATDQALKLIQIMSTVQADHGLLGDGTLPDTAADLKTIQTLLRHHDISTDDVAAEDPEDD